MENKALTPEEFQEFKANREKVSQLAAILGELHYQKTLLDLELERVKEEVKITASDQQAQLRKLGEKYGNGTIDPQTGDILPS